MIADIELQRMRTEHAERQAKEQARMSADINALAAEVKELRALSKEADAEYLRRKINPNFSEIEVSKARIVANQAKMALDFKEARLDSAVKAQM